MADYYTPASNFQAPDILGQYLAGQQAGFRQQLMPLQLQGAQLGLQQQQQGLEAGALNIDQLRMALQKQNLLMNYASRQLGLSDSNEEPTAGTAPAGASNAVAATGGIQNGPQSTVSTGPTMPSGSTYGGNYGGGIHIDPNTQYAVALLSGQDPVKALSEARDYNLKQSQLQAQGPLDMMDSIFNSAAPARTVMMNPSLMARWPQLAAQMGLDPVKDFTDQNVRAALALAANNLRGATGQPAKEYPVPEQQQAGLYGQQLQRDPVTGKVSEVSPMHVPTFDYKEEQDPNDPNKLDLVRRQTGGMPGASPTNGTPVASYLKGASENERKSAQFADYFNVARQPLEQLESQGVRLSTEARAAVINAAVNDSDGLTQELRNQLAVTYGLSPQEKEYMAALMPMMQAMGHSMAGMRLTASQMRTNFESLVPQKSSDDNAMSIIERSRDAFQRGLTTQAGSAAEYPAYKGRLSGAPQAPPDVGFVSKGYRFKGGDPSKQASWERVGG